MSMECIGGLGLFGCFYSLLPHLGPGGVVINPPTNQTAAAAGSGSGGGGGGVSPALAPAAPGGAGAPAAAELAREDRGGAGGGGSGGRKLLAPVLGGVLGGGCVGAYVEGMRSAVPVAAAGPGLPVCDGCQRLGHEFGLKDHSTVKPLQGACGVTRLKSVRFRTSIPQGGPVPPFHGGRGRGLRSCYPVRFTLRYSSC